MGHDTTRRKFAGAAAMALAGVPILSAGQQAAGAQQAPRGPRRGRGRFAPHPPRNMKVGHTGITWPREENGLANHAIQDVGSLGYAGFETFGQTLDAYEEHGGIDRVLEAAKVPLTSAYCTVDYVDPEKRKEGVDQMVAWGKLVKKQGGKITVLGPNSRREYLDSNGQFPFDQHRDNIIATLNDVGKALMDIGIVGALHPHTGTVIEHLDEVRAIMDNVDTRYVKFGPDVGQMAKGGATPKEVTKIVADYREIVQHVHLKDYSGGSYFVGYCPIGFGVIEVPEILDILEGKEMVGMVMVELDGGFRNPMPALQTAAISKEYLKNQGIEFES